MSIKHTVATKEEARNKYAAGIERFWTEIDRVEEELMAESDEVRRNKLDEELDELHDRLYEYTQREGR